MLCYEDLSPRNVLIAATSLLPRISRTMLQYCQCRSDAGVAAILSGQRIISSVINTGSLHGNNFRQAPLSAWR
nr:MAG TPA: hypothetical protein [Caudoviricetes sp.]